VHSADFGSRASAITTRVIFSDPFVRMRRATLESTVRLTLFTFVELPRAVLLLRKIFLRPHFQSKISVQVRLSVLIWIPDPKGIAFTIQL
jgi:hypothetical protein